MGEPSPSVLNLDGNLDIHLPTYEWSVRLFKVLEKLFRVNIRLHSQAGQVDGGEIFVFNHFARFETFIPQYLIYRQNGSLCRSVAASELLRNDSPLARYLLRLGAVPNDHARLLPLLAGEILRGRKVVIFPEGGMVKDRDVVDSQGRYSIYSRSAGRRRRHHTGAAVLALILDLFKAAVRNAAQEGNQRRLESWASALQLAGTDVLLSAAQRPTLIVPANITFYPIRVSENLLHRGAELLTRGLSRRLSEELLIEGNILLKDTDMDIRLGEPVQPSWRWWERRLAGHLSRGVDSLDGFFALTLQESAWHFMSGGLRRKIPEIRDEYMRRIYIGVSVNLSHLASALIMSLVRRKRHEIEKSAFQTALYLSVKGVQKRKALLHLHRSLLNPEAYQDLIGGQCAGLEQLLATAGAMKLLESVNGHYRFLPKLSQSCDIDEIRLENLITVYANEVEPIRELSHSIDTAIDRSPKFGKEELAWLRFDDELLAYEWDRQRFSGPRYQQINQEETATETGEPFLLVPEPAKALGILLVHGLSASPAEVRSFGQKLQQLGYPVMGVRLKGHGTSPWDLRERSRQEWLDSVRRGYAILSGLTGRICLVGFSTGGALSLRLAAEHPAGLEAVVSVSAPFKFRDPSMVFVPVVYAANQLTRWVSSLEGLRPFHPRKSEHPHINYRHIPTRALYELQRLISGTEKRLHEVDSPVLIIQGDDDPVVDPRSATLIQEKLAHCAKQVVMVPSKRHGILNENIGGTHDLILSFLAGI